jgi:hypothetical protein
MTARGRRTSFAERQRAALLLTLRRPDFDRLNTQQVTSRVREMANAGVSEGTISEVLGLGVTDVRRALGKHS